MCARLNTKYGGTRNSFIQKTTNIAAYTDIELQMDLTPYRMVANEGDYCRVSYQYDDDGWIVCNAYVQNATFLDESIAFPPSPSSNTLTIKFEVQSGGESNAEKCFVDNVILRGIQKTAPPTNVPTRNPTKSTIDPTQNPTLSPSSQPSLHPSERPSIDPTSDPTSDPTNNPTVTTMDSLTVRMYAEPTSDPTEPSREPTSQPTLEPTNDVATEPTVQESSSDNLAVNDVSASSQFITVIAIAIVGVITVAVFICI